MGPGPPPKTYHNIPAPLPTGEGPSGGTTSGGAFCMKHPQLCKGGSGSVTDPIIVVHRIFVNNHEEYVNPANGSSAPVVFVPNVGYVVPFNCNVNSAGDRISCDFQQVSVN